MLKITGLTKSYGNSNVKAVDNLSLEVKKGEIFGFLGPNGAGKSTTIKAIVGILPFDEGKVLINGVNLLKRPIQAKKNIGFVPDNHAVFERLTGREYINHIANLYNVPLADVEERSKKYLEIFKLTHAFDNQIKSYSHGMKQKITVISALIHNPNLWILDEPLTGLDPQSAFQLKQAMRKHADEGNTVFFSSHILDVVENLCDRVCIIKKGHLQGVYDLGEMKKKEQSLEKLFMSVIYDEDDKFDEKTQSKSSQENEKIKNKANKVLTTKEKKKKPLKEEKVEQNSDKRKQGEN